MLNLIWISTIIDVKIMDEKRTREMKWYLAFILSCVLFLCACGQQPPTWEEQYDLGVRYLSEGSYEEAIIAFSAAIEIDPNRAQAYVGRGKAYVLSGETEDNLALALADYEKAILLGETDASIYLALANIYMARGESDRAREILQEGLDLTADDSISKKLKEVDSKKRFTDFETLDKTVQAIFLNLTEEILDGNSEGIYQTLLKDHIDSVENGTISKELFTRGEICTQIGEYKASLRYNEDLRTSQLIGTIELREEKGKAYIYEAMEVDGEVISTKIVGESDSWNWNGHYEKYSNFFHDDDEDKYAYYSERGSCVNGLLNGEIYTAYPSGEFVDVCEDGKIISREVMESSHVLTVDGGYDVDYYKGLMLWDD